MRFLRITRDILCADGHCKALLHPVHMHESVVQNSEFFCALQKFERVVCDNTDQCNQAFSDLEKDLRLKGLDFVES